MYPWSARSVAVSFIVITTLAGTAPLGAQRADCGPTRQPKQLPTVSTLMDSAAAITELEAAHVVRDSMQFTLLVLAGDSVPVLHALDSTDALAAQVLARSAWPEKPSDLWAVRVHVTGGAAPTLAVTRATYCPPQPASGQPVRMVVGVEREERVTTGVIQPGVSPTLRPPHLHTVFEIQVTALGDVSDVKLVTGSGTEAIDAQIARQIAENKYEPALLDGIPVPGVYRTDKRSPRP